jgi:hypothetical protein
MEKKQLIEQKPIFGPHFRGMNREEWVTPIPGLPCLTGLHEMENSEVVANHLWLDLNLVEGLAIVDANDAPNNCTVLGEIAKRIF